MLVGAGALPSFFSFTAHSPAETQYSLQCSQLHTTIKSDQHIPKSRTINNTTIINMFPSPLTSISEQLTTSVNTSNHHLKTPEEGKTDQDSLSLSPSTKRGHDSNFVEMFRDLGSLSSLVKDAITWTGQPRFLKQKAVGNSSSCVSQA